MSLTGWIILVIFLSLLGYTAIAQKHGQPTISMQMRDWAWKWNSIAMLTGVLIGHWFVSIQNPLSHAFGFTMPFFAAYLVFDLVWHYKDYSQNWYRWPIIPCLIGIVVGAAFWGQGSPWGPI